ncbi:MAG: ATP-dependent sacrificial sulfur transferase LarE [Synergistetes bacterium]|nr:ATP-dependent sacrificial sulfur transferase LarE [Synergistota bacterium]MCX8127480.1 ATP-dependent sacrificial sulfur transferase LarE [Synergistota bacterium]MDW8192743.1 ATP-dependent sacrificial sulfur transferase LarE [Synergistota bacterium]
MKIVIATTNEGKFKEIKAFLEREINEEIEILSLSDFSEVPEVKESAKTIRGNALLKGKVYSRFLSLPVIVEDSALEVDALNGAPGVYSSRYGRDDQERISKLLKALEGVPFEDRTARFRCVMVLALPTGERFVSQGKVEGTITTFPRGSSGFGYDPIFFYTPLGKTFAELSREEKLAVSHRGKALRGILKFVKFLHLGEILRGFNKVAVALSGGIDSSFLAFSAKRFCDEVYALFADTPFLTEEARIRVRKHAELLGVKLVSLKLNLLSLSELSNNSALRCYYCKKAMYELFLDWAKDKNLIVLDGTNFSDLSEDRPGLKALEELKVVSPLKLAKLTKEEIRELSKYFKLPFWNQPPGTCLATRFYRGLAIDSKILRKVEEAEAYLKLLGFKVVRVRVDQPDICRVEFGKDEIKRALNPDLYVDLVKEFKRIGFNRVSVDLEGYKA